MRLQYISLLAIPYIIYTVVVVASDEKNEQCSVNHDGSQTCSTKAIDDTWQIEDSRERANDVNAKIDKSEDCQSWASKGECYSNPEYMIPNCPISCKNVTNHMDINGKCSEYAQYGECEVNPRYMKRFCAKSCYEYEQEILSKKPWVFPKERKRLMNLRSEKCQLFMAESSIPKAGLGMYTAVDVYAGEAVFHPEVVVSFFDNMKHAERNVIYKMQQKEQKLWASIGEKVDSDPQCSAWARREECEKNPKYMLHYCAKSCALNQSGMLDLDHEKNWLPMSYYWDAGELIIRVDTSITTTNKKVQMFTNFLTC